MPMIPALAAGLFFTLFLLFVRVLPVIAISEVKGVLPEADGSALPPPLIRRIAPNVAPKSTSIMRRMRNPVATG